MTDPAELTAACLLDAYRSGDLSPVEVARACLERIDRLDDRVNGFCFVDPEETLAQARASEGRWQSGEPHGILDGVPVAVKDLLLTVGWPTLRGSFTIDATSAWTDDAPSVAALRREGAVLTGKTATPELGWKGVTDSPRHGITRNPWNTQRSAGGSSGGSATAVSLGMSPLALGTDGGGSIRIPSSFCGIFGFKPTYGRIPLWPASPFGTLAHVGPMSRTVEDAALLLDAISGPDYRDPTALGATEPVHARLRNGVRGLRIAVSGTLGYATVDPQIITAVERAATVFDQLGADVELVETDIPDLIDEWEKHWYVGAATATVGKDLSRSDPGLAEIAKQGRQTSLLDYMQATLRRIELGIRMGELHERYDLLLTPTLPLVAFEAGRDVPADWPDSRWQTWSPFTYPFNLTGQPAATIPCGLTDDELPIGVQLVGARHADALVMRAAWAYEQAAPFEQRPLTAGLGASAPKESGRTGLLAGRAPTSEPAPE